MMNATEVENKEVEVIVVGRLGQLGLGNEHGIPGALETATDQQVQQEAEKLKELLVDVTDTKSLRCIDGRHCKCNADGSPAQVRLARVGGTAANIGTALNADAPIVTTLAPNDTLGHKINVVDDYVTSITGLEASAHLGGCGGAKGEVKHQRTINTNPDILVGVEALMEIPLIKNAIGTTYDPVLGAQVVQNAGRTADFLEQSGWDGNKYVEGAALKNPAGVEDLEVDHDDELFHGHKEEALIIVVGDKTIAQDDEFVWNIQASIQVARALAGDRGKEGYTQALIAEFAKHLAVAADLPSKNTPVIVVGS